MGHGPEEGGSFLVEATSVFNAKHDEPPAARVQELKECFVFVFASLCFAVAGARGGTRLLILSTPPTEVIPVTIYVYGGRGPKLQL